jgi:hypothetical protein
MLTACASWRKPASIVASHRLVVHPLETSSGIKEIKGPHVAYWNPDLSNHKLLITIGGTTSKPEDLADFALTAVNLGYHVISIDYFNLVITTECRESKDNFCFDKFRREIALGAPVSDLMNVDEKNSIVSRLHKFMQYLVAHDAQWKEFYENGDFKWNKIVLMGNSQGAGHAAYLSKLHEVARVVMVIGPQDHFKDHPAPWLSQEGATPGDRYYSFLHRDDYFDSKMQIACYESLCKCHNMNHVIITSRPVQDTHNSLLMPVFREEWERLLDF